MVEDKPGAGKAEHFYCKQNAVDKKWEKFSRNLMQPFFNRYDKIFRFL